MTPWSRHTEAADMGLMAQPAAQEAIGLAHRHAGVGNFHLDVVAPAAGVGLARSRTDRGGLDFGKVVEKLLRQRLGRSAPRPAMSGGTEKLSITSPSAWAAFHTIMLMPATSASSSSPAQSSSASFSSPLVWRTHSDQWRRPNSWESSLACNWTNLRWSAARPCCSRRKASASLRLAPSRAKAIAASAPEAPVASALAEPDPRPSSSSTRPPKALDFGAIETDGNFACNREAIAYRKRALVQCSRRLLRPRAGRRFHRKLPPDRECPVWMAPALQGLI